jgi:hypothetical protein
VLERLEAPDGLAELLPFQRVGDRGVDAMLGGAKLPLQEIRGHFCRKQNFIFY